MRLIVGLGNPGREYASTRHNAGFMVIDRLAREIGVVVGKRMFKTLLGLGRINGKSVMLAKPQTYMNLSGGAVGALMNWHKITPTDLIVIYDDLDLPPGKLRIRPDGSSGGHKGMQSVIQALGTENFCRIRVGIGRSKDPNFESVDYVLSRLDGDDVELMGEAVELAAEAALCVVRDGVERAMNLYNRKNSTKTQG